VSNPNPVTIHKIGEMSEQTKPDITKSQIFIALSPRLVVLSMTGLVSLRHTKGLAQNFVD
jgi:hypothetical protein